MTRKLDVKEALADTCPICPHCREELTFLRVKSKGLGFIERLDPRVLEPRVLPGGFGTVAARGGASAAGQRAAVPHARADAAARARTR